MQHHTMHQSIIKEALIYSAFPHRPRMACQSGNVSDRFVSGNKTTLLFLRAVFGRSQ